MRGIASHAGLDISLRTGSGTGQTTRSALDAALQAAGVGDLNLVTISNAIPKGSRLRHVTELLPAEVGDLLFCMRAEAFASVDGEVAWAGLGWCVDATGAGLFVNHTGVSEASVMRQIEMSLADMNARRGGIYGPVQAMLASAECSGDPVCAVAIAAYRVATWDGDADDRPGSSDPNLAFTPETVDPQAVPVSNVAIGAPFPGNLWGGSTKRSADPIRDDLRRVWLLRQLNEVDGKRAIWNAHRNGLTQRQIGELVGRSQPDVGRTLKKIERDPSVIDVSAREVALWRAVGLLPDQSLLDWFRLSIPMMSTGEVDPSPVGEAYLAGRWDDVRQLHREGLLTDDEWDELFALKFGKSEDTEPVDRLNLAGIDQVDSTDDVAQDVESRDDSGDPDSSEDSLSE
jgi:arginine decarboxylase